MSAFTSPHLRNTTLGMLCASASLFLAGNADAIDRTVVAKHGMVVAGHPLAVESGRTRPNLELRSKRPNSGEARMGS